MLTVFMLLDLATLASVVVSLLVNSPTTTTSQLNFCWCSLDTVQTEGRECFLFKKVLLCAIYIEAFMGLNVKGLR